MSLIPHDFGLPNGTSIANKNTILDEIDKSLSSDKPCIEYILVKPWSNLHLPFGYGLHHLNTYGHSALRYVDPDGNDIVVNIEGEEEATEMVNFYPSKEYLYGVTDHGIQQAVYNREMVGIRIEDIDKEDVEKLHKFFLNLQKGNIEGTKDYALMGGNLINVVSSITNKFTKMPKYGNCAEWISEGLKEIDIVTAKTMWPKAIFIDILENHDRTKVKHYHNLNIVYYERPKHAKLSYGKDCLTIESVAFLQPIRNYIYFDLKQFSNCIVTIEEDSLHAKPTLSVNVKKPCKYRNLLNHFYLIGWLEMIVSGGLLMSLAVFIVKKYFQLNRMLLMIVYANLVKLTRRLLRS